VLRRQDFATKGEGPITGQPGVNEIKGISTSFLTSLHIGDSFAIVDDQTTPTVKEIIDNNKVIVDMPFEKQLPESGVPYKILAKIDQSTVFNSVWETLAQNK